MLIGKVRAWTRIRVAGGASRHSAPSWTNSSPTLKASTHSPGVIDASSWVLTNSTYKLGCGNSQLSVELHKAGYTNMVNIDISPVCVANMKEEYPELSFLEMDMTRLSFPDNSFDLVVEKATLDSLLVDAKSPWNLTSPGHKLVSKALRQVDCD